MAAKETAGWECVLEVLFVVQTEKTVLIEKLKRGDQDFLLKQKKKRIKSVAAATDPTRYECNTELSEQGTQTEDHNVPILSTFTTFSETFNDPYH